MLKIFLWFPLSPPVPRILFLTSFLSLMSWLRVMAPRVLSVASVLTEHTACQSGEMCQSGRMCDFSLAHPRIHSAWHTVAGPQVLCIKGKDDSGLRDV